MLKRTVQEEARLFILLIPSLTMEPFSAMEKTPLGGDDYLDNDDDHDHHDHDNHENHDDF